MDSEDIEQPESPSSLQTKRNDWLECFHPCKGTMWLTQDTILEKTGDSQASDTLPSSTLAQARP